MYYKYDEELEQKALSKSVSKKRGRPATGQYPVTAIRLSPEIRKRVDDWASGQPGKLKRSEAIRQLLQIGLVKSAPSERLRHLRAAESHAEIRSPTAIRRQPTDQNRLDRGSPDPQPRRDPTVDSARPKH